MATCFGIFVAPGAPFAEAHARDPNIGIDILGTDGVERHGAGLRRRRRIDTPMQMCNELLLREAETVGIRLRTKHNLAAVVVQTQSIAIQRDGRPERIPVGKRRTLGENFDAAGLIRDHECTVPFAVTVIGDDAAADDDFLGHQPALALAQRLQPNDGVQSARLLFFGKIETARPAATCGTDEQSTQQRVNECNRFHRAI